MEKTLKEIKTEILSRLNIRTEYESLGVVLKGNPNARGWITCRNPYNQDNNPSCGINVSSSSERGYLCTFNMNGNGHNSSKINQAFSLFDIAADFLPGANGEFKFVLRHYAEKTGVRFGKTRTPPTPEIIKSFIKALPPDAREYLNTKRGLSDESIAKYEIGFRTFDIRNTFPVYDSDNTLVNIRYHNSKLKPKTLNQPGFGEARLWGADRLAKATPESIVCVTAGEFDSMLLEQETGLISVSPTNGESAFDYAFVPSFHGHHVVLVRDCDEPGRRSVEKVVLPAFQKSVASGKILSLKIIWLYGHNATKDEKDFTDYIVKSGGSGAKLLELIKSTIPHKYSQEQVDTPPVDPDTFFDGKSFVAADMLDYLSSKSDFIYDDSNFFKYNKSKGVWDICAENTISNTVRISLGRRVKKCYVTEVVKMLEWKSHKDPEQLKVNPYLINLQNGMLDINEGKFIEHNKKYFSRIQIPIKFDEEATCPRWQQFLAEIFPDDPSKAKALQDFAGYCFLHEILFEKCLFLLGTGANGKSVFINTLIKVIGFQNTCSLDPGIFGKDKFLLGSLKDKLLNTCSELDTREQIAANIFKNVVSGGLVQADRKYQKDPYMFFPIAKHIFSMNEVPVIRDKSFAFERRLIVVRFNRTFRGDDMDYQLEKKLSTELSGIFNWAMKGLERIMTEHAGITETAQMQKDRKVFIRQINPILVFVDEECSLEELEAVEKTKLYDQYNSWCKGSGLRQLSKIRFYNQIIEDFPEVKERKPKNGAPREFVGIGLKY